MIHGTEHFVRLLANEAELLEEEAVHIHAAYTRVIRQALENGVSIPLPGIGVLKGRFVPPGRVVPNNLPNSAPTRVKHGRVKVGVTLDPGVGIQLYQESPLSDMYTIQAEAERGEECVEDGTGQVREDAGL
jgi:hypothetical protein